MAGYRPRSADDARATGLLAALVVADERATGRFALLRAVADARTVDFVAVRAAVLVGPVFAPARRASFFFFAMRLTRHHVAQRFAAEQMQM